MLENINKSVSVKAIMSHHQLVHQALTELGQFRKGLQMLLNATELPLPESNLITDIFSNEETKYANCFSLSLDEVVLDLDSLIGDIAKVYNLNGSQFIERTTLSDRLETIFESFTIMTNSLNTLLSISKQDRRIDDLIINAHELQETYDGFTNPFANGLVIFVERFTEFQLSFLNQLKNKIGLDRFNSVSQSLVN